MREYCRTKHEPFSTIRGWMQCVSSYDETKCTFSSWSLNPIWEKTIFFSPKKGWSLMASLWASSKVVRYRPSAHLNRVLHDLKSYIKGTSQHTQLPTALTCVNGPVINCILLTVSSPSAIQFSLITSFVIQLWTFFSHPLKKKHKVFCCISHETDYSFPFLTFFIFLPVVLVDVDRTYHLHHCVQAARDPALVWGHWHQTCNLWLVKA